MTIYFGENIKRLRKENDLTQERLAEFLGVTFQAVSKWERGETYPDITLLPAISSFFNISIDDLIGVDKVKNEEKIKEYLNIYDRMTLKDTSSIFAEFQKAVKEFPGEFPILIRYMELLKLEKDSVLYPDYEKTSEELMSIYKNIQNRCTDDSIRIWAKRIAVEHLMKKYQCTCNEEGKYCICKEYFEQAESIINKLPSISDSKEYLYPALCDKYNRHEIHEKSIDEFAYHLQNLVIGYCYYDDKYSPETKIEAIKSINGIFDLIHPDGNYGKNWLHLIYNYGHLGHLYFETGDSEKAIKYLRLAAEHAVRCDAQPEISERAAWFYEREEVFRDMNMRSRMTLLIKKHYPLSDEFKASPEFIEIIDLLGNIDIEDIVL